MFSAMRRPPRWAVVTLSFVSVLLALGGVALALAAYDPTRHGARSFACMSVLPADGTGKDDGYCDRFVADLARRPELSGRQKADLAGFEEAIDRALGDYARCGVVDSPGVECVQRHARARLAGSSGPSRPAAGSEVEPIRRVLVAAGFPNAVVRVAGRDDPAPRGTILFAVPVLDACVLGHVTPGGSNASHRALATLPGGRCI